jgi:hypothetical protein
MACMTGFLVGDGEYGVIPSAKYDGDPATFIREFTPSDPEWRCHPRSYPVIIFGCRGGGGRRARSTLVTETNTMIVIGILFGAIGIGFLCWLWAYRGYAGLVGAILVGLLAGVVTLVAGR